MTAPDTELLRSTLYLARADLHTSLLLYNRTVLSAGGFPLEPQSTVSDALREDLRKARRDVLDALALQQSLDDWLNSSPNDHEQQPDV